MKRIVTSLAAASLFYNTAVCAQMPQGQSVQPLPHNSGKLVSVSGTVLNLLTREPVPRALVQVNSTLGGRPLSALTGADGRFNLAGVPKGPIYINAQKPGFLDPHQVPKLARDAGSSSFTAEESAASLSVYLVTMPSLSGKIVDSDGEPIENANVYVFTPNYVNGRKVWNPTGSAVSDDLGRYEISSLMPGQAVVCTGQRMVLPDLQASRGVFPEICEPPSAQGEFVQTLELQPDRQEVLDFRLTPVEGFAVTGFIQGSIPGSVGISAAGPSGRQTAIPLISIDPRKRTFRLAGLTEGSWKIFFMGSDADQRSVFASLPLTISGHNLSGLNVELKPTTNIRLELAGGRTTGESNSAEVGSPGLQWNVGRGFLQVHLFNQSNLAGVAQQQWDANVLVDASNNVAEDSQSSLQNVPPGTYVVSAHASINDYCLAGISYGGVDLSRQLLTLSEGASSSPLTVSLRKDCSSLKIKITNPSEAGEGETVVLVPDALFLQPQSILLSGGQSELQLSNLTPANYHLFLLPWGTQVDYSDANIMGQFPSVSVALTASTSATVTLGKK